MAKSAWRTAKRRPRVTPSLEGALAGFLLIAACASAEPPAPPPGTGGASDGAVPDAGSFELTAGVVLAPPAGTVYLAQPGGGIEALDVPSGRLLWSSDEAVRPLVATGGRLLAQREGGAALALVVLDAASGELRQRIAAPLPEGVYAAVDESLRVRFTLAARAAAGGAILQWEYLERDPLGVSPPGGRPFARRDLGALKVDLAAGTATPVSRDELPAAALPARLVELLAAGELLHPPWRAGDLLAATRQLYEPDRLVLRRWRQESGEELPRVVLHEGRAVAVLPAADRRHLLIVTATEAARGEGDYLWRVHSLTSGEPVAERRSGRSATPFCLLGETLLFVEPPSGRRVESSWEERPLALRAVDAGSGAERWWRPVRDSAFRGPAPPLPPATPNPA